MAIDETTRSHVVVETKGSAEPPPDPGTEMGVLDLFKRIYQFFYSKTVGLILIIAMAVLGVIGALVTQAGAGVYSDESAKAAFLDAQREKFRGLTGILDFLGFFRMFSSPIFLVVTAMLALSIIACTTHRIPQLWQRWRHPRTHVSDRFFELARYRGSFETDSPERDAMAGLRAQLKAKHYRVVSDDADPERSLYADKFAWGGFGTVVAHISFIVILAAFVISASGGIDDTLYLPIGADPVDVGHGTGVSVQARSFDAPVSDEGRPLDYVSHLVAFKNGAQVAEQNVRVNEPLRVDKVRFHQADFGFGAQVLVKDPSGTTVYQGLVPFHGTANNGLLQAGTHQLPGGYQLNVFTAASGVTDSGLAAGEAAIQIARSDGSAEPVMETVQQGTTADVGEFSITFERERQYTQISVRQDPGAVWMWIGSALLILGMSVTFACRHRRLWIRVVDDGATRRLLFASNDKEDLSFERSFTSLVYDMSDALQQQAKDVKEKSHA